MARDELRIRVMTEADVAAVSAIRVRGWQTAYVGMVPQDYLDAMDAEEDARQRRERLAKSTGRVHNLVAEEVDDDGSASVVGWAAFGPYRGEDVGARTGELYALYARQDRIGAGVGRALTAEVIRRSAELGRDRLALWVLTGNARARRFYAAAGFSPDGATMTELYGGTPVEEMRCTLRLG